MGTLTIRKVPDEQIQQLKEAAAQHNRSMEAEVRSVLEEHLAGYVAHGIAENTNFYDRMRAFMEQEGIEGFTEEEFPLPERSVEDSRPPVMFE
ncbi:DNA-binding protein [Bifidobacterium sp. DSM 109958]|uniref:DNA-binding protein n=1 Tax=Bifidobacterium moraviense TaxID=2675323 RepID=A0A7Y0F2D5_9BIFI|nr:DNA-binding protein [Bifidobacterium sp. DSM 109958]NMN00780.1 DNA-binding protein [Bifidobacterium sp. DSM 109958]